jgi:hypothetical protein
MNWVEDEYRQRGGEQVQRPRAVSNSEERLDAKEEDKWAQLVHGLQQDVEDYKQVGGEAKFQQVSDRECRVASGKSLIAVVLKQDPEARTIRYEYQALRDTVAAPEGGMLTMRASNGSTELYSADERLNAEDARRLVLEPLLFPRAALDGLEPTGT